MIRTVGYGVLGFCVFGVVGILIGTAMYPNNDQSQSSTVIVMVTAVIGAVGSVYFARWMNARGDAKLTKFSKKPKVGYGIAGAVVGALGSIRIARYLDPTDGATNYDLLGITIGICVCAYLAVLIARRLDLPDAITTYI